MKNWQKLKNSFLYQYSQHSLNLNYEKIPAKGTLDHDTLLLALKRGIDKNVKIKTDAASIFSLD